MIPSFLGMLMIGFAVVVVSTAQMIGGIAANAILAGLTPGGLDVQLTLGMNTSPAQGVFIEMFATSALVLSVLMLGAGEYIAIPLKCDF
jgi:aquaporin related protein